MPQMQEELLARARSGDETAYAAVIAHMMPAIQKGAALYTAPGLEREDIVQEGLIGLFHAVRSYHADAGVPFAAFAATCIRNAQQDACKMALRKKHAPLNFGVPLPDAETSTDTRPGPEEQVIAGEACADTLQRVKTLLSDTERRVLLASLDGQPVRQIADRLGTSPKSIANALARARRKLRGTQP